ncbi:synaptosomal-associated protein 25-like isoform X4 [Physella acuta]|uniref:synaptosomal-associated protein 25-like isoform X4 n=1 Tax=Physella acuta TaxID=109671 RepID=UPI0027DAEA9A|nr:synaptosomal-associated protein 25-like isoform X4 [Physella acuta]
MEGKGDTEMRTELQELQMQANLITDESLESTRRMLAMCEESQDVAVKTIVMLDHQGEQMDRIEEGMDQINQDMRDAEKNLEGLEKCCGLCVLPWKRSKNFEKGSDYNKTWKASEDGKVNTNGPRVMVDQGNGSGPTGGYITRITNDAREDEMEQNISEVSGMVSNLRNMAVDMGNEIESQNRQLDRINQKGGSLNVRVDEANKRANKILRNQ